MWRLKQPWRCLERPRLAVGVAWLTLVWGAGGSLGAVQALVTMRHAVAAGYPAPLRLGGGEILVWCWLVGCWSVGLAIRAGDAVHAVGSRSRVWARLAPSGLSLAFLSLLLGSWSPRGLGHLLHPVHHGLLCGAVAYLWYLIAIGLVVLLCVPPAEGEQSICF